MEKIDHIGVAVKNLGEAIKVYTSLGLRLERVEEIRDQKVKIAFFPIGESHIELIEGTSPESVISRFIESKGEGIHHIAVLVEDIEKALESARKVGIELIDERPKVGAGGARIAFLHPKSLKGLLLEFCER